MSGNNFHTNIRFFNELVFKRSGEVPTIPVLPNLTQQSPLWKQATDINDGEWAVNRPDKIVFIRIGQQIISFNISQLPIVIGLSHQRLHALDSVLDHSSKIKPGDLMDADNNGLPHDSGITTASVNNIINASSGIKFQIESGEVVKVDNDYQYLLRDHLYLNGGTIQLNGNAEMIIL